MMINKLSFVEENQPTITQMAKKEVNQRLKVCNFLCFVNVCVNVTISVDKEENNDNNVNSDEVMDLHKQGVPIHWIFIRRTN